MSNITGYVCVKNFDNKLEGIPVKGFLEAHGIKSKFSNHRRDIRFSKLMGFGIGLFVRQKDAEKAKAMLDEFED